jgi:spore germination protein GerM
MTGPGRVGRRALALALAAIGLAACGIPTGKGPTVIAKADIPFHLLSPPTASTGTTTPSVGVQPETIYLVAASQRVAPVAREVAVPPTPSDTINEVLGALLQGPTAEDSAAGLQSFLVAGTKPQVSTTISGNTATVNFTADPVGVGPNQTLGIAQIVFTVTQPQFGISLVAFEIAGTPKEVPTASGANVPGPVSRLSYLPQAPVA